MAKPIFVVGWRRTGTTWLASLISQHSNVACVKGHIYGSSQGIAESVYFSNIAGMFGKLKIHNNLVQLIETFCNSTFFHLSGLNKELLYRARPISYEGLFRLCMDRLAKVQGAEYWLEKTPAHSFHLEEIFNCYKDAKFVAIKRDIFDQIRSAVTLIEKVNKTPLSVFGKFFFIVRKVFAYHACYKHIKHFQARHPDRIISVKYQDIISSTREAITSICEFLGLDFQAGMLELEDKPNTSFGSEKERKLSLSSGQVNLVLILNSCFAFLPFSFYSIIYMVKRKLDGLKLPFWFYSSRLEEYGWDKIYL